MERNSAMDYSIKWDLLTPEEVKYFDNLGIKRLPHGIEFSKNPTWQEFTLVLAYLVELEKRIDDKDNHIAFAIGYCVHTGVELFEEERVFSWVDEFSNLLAMRDITLKMTGSLIIQLQQVENQVMLFCTAMELKGVKLSLQDFLSNDTTKRKQTLGQLAHILKEEKIFNDDFERRLTQFVERRNRFIHNLWIEQSRKFLSESGLPSAQQYEEILDFINDLRIDAENIYGVFKGFYYLVDSHMFKKEIKDENASQQWRIYIEEFNKVLRYSDKKQS